MQSSTYAIALLAIVRCSVSEHRESRRIRINADCSRAVGGAGYARRDRGSQQEQPMNPIGREHHPASAATSRLVVVTPPDDLGAACAKPVAACAVSSASDA